MSAPLNIPVPATDAANKPVDGTVTITEFKGTRDAIVTGLMTLIEAINNLIRSYITHTNEVLGIHANLPPGVLDSAAISNLFSARGVGGSGSAATNAMIQQHLGWDPTATKKQKKPRKLRDPNAPKRPLTAYFLYQSQARTVVKEDLAKRLGRAPIPSEVTGEVLHRWKTMGATEKKTWTDEYARNADKYRQDVAEYKARTGKDLVAEVVDAEHDDDDAVGEDESAAGGALKAASSSESESAGEEHITPFAPPPLPAAKKATGKGRKGKAAAVQPSLSPSAQLLVPKQTPVPLPSHDAAQKPPKGEKRKKDDASGEPKRKKARKGKAPDNVTLSDLLGESSQPVPPVKEKKKKRKAQPDAAA